MNRTDRTIISNKLSAVSIRDFLLVTTVWKRSSFRVAARELGISPSGLSHQVRKVEEALGTTLFERSSQQVKATLEGEVLLSHIQDVLGVVGKLDLLAVKTSRPFGGHLKLGAISTIGAYVLPYVVNLFEANFPNVRIDLLEGKTEGVTQRLRGSEIDMMLSCRFADNADMETKPLFTERFDLIVNVAHPLAANTSINVQDLDASEFMTMADGEGYSEDTLPATIRTAQHDYNACCTEIRGLSLETIGALVSTRGGASLVPSLASPRLSTFPNVKIVSISGRAPQRTIYASWRRSSPHQEAFHQLCHVLSEMQAVCDLPIAGASSL